MSSLSRPDGSVAVEPLHEKEFYLDEFRGRSVLISIAPAAAAVRFDLAPLGAAVADLVRNDTRVMVWWPVAGLAAERRLRTALARAVGARGRHGAPRPLPPLVHLDAVQPAGDAEALRAALWDALRREPLCVIAAGNAPFPDEPVALAVALRVPKLVLLDPAGGVLPADSPRLSFVDDNVLETLLRDGQAEWAGLADRRGLLAAVQEALRGGVEAVNVCPPEGVAQELFTYAGSGTLFTRGDYCRVAPLGLEDYAQAERLLERGQRDGVLKMRDSVETAQVLAAGYGARICDRHLAGVAALVTAPYAAERAGEIVGLYTITRFKGEGIGERLVASLVAEAERRGLAYVFACAIDERAMQFFQRLGFTRVDPRAVPPAKWVGYDPRRRARLGVFRREIAAPPPA